MITHHIAVVVPQKYGIAVEQSSMARSSTLTLRITKVISKLRSIHISDT